MVDTIRVQYNQEALASYGLTMANAAEQVSTAMNGQKLGEVIKNQDHWNIVLRIDPRLKTSMEDVKNLELISPNKKPCAWTTWHRCTGRKFPTSS